MNINESLFISKCKNGFFVHSMSGETDFAEAIADGMVFQDFYALLTFLNSHFPSDEVDRKILVERKL